MLISRQSRFIFLSNPKCATTTIRKLLRDRCEITAGSIIRDAKEVEAKKFFSRKAVNLLHISAHQLHKSFNRSKGKAPQSEEASLLNWEDFYVFGTIRNPFKRMVSWYFFLQPDKDFNTIMDVRGKNGYDVSTAYQPHFNDFIDHLRDNLWKSLPTYDLFYNDWNTGELLVNDVFKVEELDNVFVDRFKEVTGIELPSPLPTILPDFQVEEQSWHVKFKGDAYELYNDSSQQFIEEHFASELEKFDYSFGN